MKKTIAAMALLVSASNALAIAPPHHEKREFKDVCLEVWQTGQDGSQRIGTCDETKNNKQLKRQILENGCAEGQVQMTVEVSKTDIRSCWAPGVVQL